VFLDTWLLGFNNEDIKISMFSTEKFNLKNAIINPTRVNQDLLEQKAPFRLKAGLIGKLSVKVSSSIFLYYSVPDIAAKLVLRVSEH
jgi:hypothetical protein